MNTIVDNSPTFLYTFTMIGLDESIHVIAKSNVDCKNKIFNNFNRFEKLFEFNICGIWNKGGLINYIMKNKRYFLNTNYAATNYIFDVNPPIKDKTLLTNLIFEHKDTLFTWITSKNEKESICYTITNINEVVN